MDGVQGVRGAEARSVPKKTRKETKVYLIFESCRVSRWQVAPWQRGNDRGRYLTCVKAPAGLYYLVDVKKGVPTRRKQFDSIWARVSMSYAFVSTISFIVSLCPDISYTMRIIEYALAPCLSLKVSWCVRYRKVNPYVGDSSGTTPFVHTSHPTPLIGLPHMRARD